MRASGILMHISSLPSPYGIGTLGKAARDFGDFLQETKTGYWQILPTGPTSYGDSPYQALSAYAGNPYFIDLQKLIEDGYLEADAVGQVQWQERDDKVDYAGLYQKRYPILRQAFQKFITDVPDDFEEFCKRHQRWLDDYALFMAEKDDHEGKAWYEWEDGLKFREEELLAKERVRLAEDLSFYKTLQYWFYQQWEELREYLRQRDIQIIGDIPMYVAYDSVEVWMQPELFSLDEELKQVKVAGCPPDVFNADGQMWGNPIYRWDKMRRDDYAWWKLRLGHMLEMCDVVRIDHFRGFSSYFSIPAEDENAKGGEWIQGPGREFFDSMKRRFGKMNIIAEDLGFITQDVLDLMKHTGYPGMKILQFGFDDDNGNSTYRPHTYEANSVVYTGTHDNDTTMGWLEHEPDWKRNRVREYLGLNGEEGWHWGFIRGAVSSVCALAVIPMQDLLGLGSDARMNRPSTLGDNWDWRMREGAINEDIRYRWRNMNHIYGREI